MAVLSWWTCVHTAAAGMLETDSKIMPHLHYHIHRVSVCSPGEPQTWYPPASASQLELFKEGGGREMEIWHRVSDCILVWPRTHYVTHPSIRLLWKPRFSRRPHKQPNLWNRPCSPYSQIPTPAFCSELQAGLSSAPTAPFQLSYPSFYGPSPISRAQ